jgi:hypothetical protein
MTWDRNGIDRRAHFQGPTTSHVSGSGFLLRKGTSQHDVRSRRIQATMRGVHGYCAAPTPEVAYGTPQHRGNVELAPFLFPSLPHVGGFGYRLSQQLPSRCSCHFGSSPTPLSLLLDRDEQEGKTEVVRTHKAGLALSWRSRACRVFGFISFHLHSSLHLLSHHICSNQHSISHQLH